MIVLELRFPAGRYHATPWGRHVNEGAVEWPPSPWRLLRTLIATWHLKASKDVPEGTLRGLIKALSELPECSLPAATTAHTRHFMPVIEGKNEKKTKIFDAFVQVDPSAAIKVAWNVELSAAELDALRILCERVCYFGRAESLVEISVANSSDDFVANSTPLSDDVAQPTETELVRTLVPMGDEAYSNWRAEISEKSAKAEGPRKKSKKTEGAHVPKDIFEALHADTGELQAAGWNLPPGSRYVNYVRAENAFAAPARLRRRSRATLLTVARYTLKSAVMPSLLNAVSVSDQLHKVLVGLSQQRPVFTGAEADGNGHAHIFCESNDTAGLGHITHVTVFARDGFDEKALQTLRRLQWTHGKKGHEYRLVLHGIGKEEDFPDCCLFREAKSWRSITPFVATRHAKTFRDGRPKMDENGWQIGSPGHDLLRLLSLQPDGVGAHVQLMAENKLPYDFGARRVRSLQFQTVRHNGGGSHGHQSGAAFRITFREAKRGPFALGYGAHFGLGLFAPQE